MQLLSLRTASLLSVLALVACDKKPSTELAPSASALAPAERASASAQAFEIESTGSTVSFVMDAPIEKIHGEVKNATEGQLFIDPADLTQSTGLIKVDLYKLELFQQKRADDKSEFGERVKSEKQNEHARTWLQISEDGPADEREKNRWVEYKIEKINTVSAANLNELKGAERNVNLTVEGELRLHQRKSKKQAKVAATFKYDGDKLTSVTLKSLEPISVSLEEHDVRPRELFGKLAQKTLSDLGQKVAKEAPIELQISAKAK